MWFLGYFLLHLLVYTLIRAEFLIWNRASFVNLSHSDIVLAFLNGIRFDLSALAFTVGLCFLGLIWLAENKLLSKIWIGLFAGLNAAFLLINFVDVELYNFTAKRFTSSSFILVQEAHLSNLVLPYLQLALASLLLLTFYFYGIYSFVKKFNYQNLIFKKIAHTFLVILISVLFSRGGFQHKPLSFVDAKIFENTYANNLVLNSTFTVLKSSTHASLKRLNYMPQAEMLKELNARENQKVFSDKSQKLNVVILVLESFSEEYSELRNPEVMPYFNKLRTESVNFKNSYANGRRSIEGIAAILSGIPALMEEPFISSEFSANQIIGLGSIVAAQGYNTSFFHATNKGSMHFDSFSKSVGVTDFFSREDFPDQRQYDGTWGIFDEPFLKWTCEKLTKIQPPFFSTIFTLSSHQPYTLPPEHEGRFKDERLPILKSIQYADYALEQFMKCAQKQDWFKNTFFILTADHTGPELNKNASFISRYQIPILLYGPYLPWLKQVNDKQFAQHIDILPTLLDVLNIEQKNVNYLSRSLLRDGEKTIALYSDGQYELVGRVTNKEQQLKAIQQYFSQGLYDNRLYFPVK